MPKNLFIVESPNKCSKIKSILGKDYTVKASVGHIRKIPEKGMHIDVKNGFTPTYVVSPDKKKVVKELKEAAKKAEKIYLATDLDAEGEAIAWHIYDVLPKSDQSKCCRVGFTEITKKAIFAAIDNAGEIDMNGVNSQKARQVLDRLIGYTVSPVLWTKAFINKSSAGRVQSVALKLICERQKLIDAFKPEDYWFLEATLACKEGEFDAKVVTKEKDNRYKDEKIAKDDLAKLKKAIYNIEKVERKEKKNSAPAPFDTNSMQIACSNVFGWNLNKSRTLAQKLYENGLVTYIRTDSFNIAEEALTEVRGLIKKASSCHLSTKANVFKKKSKSTQEAHECIRPTHVYDKGDDISDPDAQKMYKLIRDRFMACQMKPQLVDVVVYHIKTDTGHKLIASGQTVKFDGWTKVYKHVNTKENILPDVGDKETLTLKDMKKTKHTTKPPARYNEASLSKKMEDEGVGRPSTRTSIISAIQKKNYVERERGKKGLVATPLGMQIFDYLNPNFEGFFMDVKYTSKLEEDLDLIGQGEKNFLEVVGDVYKVLMDYVGKAGGKVKIEDKETGETCPVCKEGSVVEKSGRFGKFFSCNRYPECKSIFEKNEDGKYEIKKKKEQKKTGHKCTKCGEGDVIERSGKFGTFYACNNYPKCKTIYVENDDGNFEVQVKKAKYKKEKWKEPKN